MQPKKALELLHDAIGTDDCIIANKARRGRTRIRLAREQQLEVLMSLTHEHFNKDEPARNVEKAGWHYYWYIDWQVPTEDARRLRSCRIFVKFRVPPDESFVDVTSFCEDGDTWV